MARKWIDGSGMEIPVSRVTDQEKKREKLVEKVFKKVLRIRSYLQKGKGDIATLIEEYLDELSSDNSVDNWKGNASISNFANTLKIERSVNELLDFSEEITLAQTKINECIKSWSERSNANLKLVVNDAFRTDSKGKLNKQRIIGLRRLNISEPIWNEAMELIDRAIRIVDSRTYYTFHVRIGAGQWMSVSLNFSYIDENDESATKALDRIQEEL